jgi:hydrogenase nickel incorporation protein HypA/HybF
MHELAVTRQILDISISKARENQASKISFINLVIGDLSSFVDDCIQFNFQILARDTMAEKAKLFIQRVPVELVCKSCSCSFTPHSQPWRCPQCQGMDFDITKGNEFYLDSIEVD